MCSKVHSHTDRVSEFPQRYLRPSGYGCPERYSALVPCLRKGIDSTRILPVRFIPAVSRSSLLIATPSIRYGPGDYPMAVSLVSRGLVDLKPLVTHRFKFTDALKAFQVTQAGKDEQGMVSILPLQLKALSTDSMYRLRRLSSVSSLDRNKFSKKPRFSALYRFWAVIAWV